ncbi:type VI secretion system contractile sheath large subunit [Roseisolibacter agri]|uniref:type VI secretion system contractile sheath large subunit n=1 Tax=Roseisolibacter agri TaxID=2014610 RepID=UPI0024E0D988|nr:type VI secretion system contractile sheath large subunit [Roseisolibacter agri]
MIAGTLLQGQFRVERVLGQPGGFGITYRAMDEDLRIPVALKEYIPIDIAYRGADGLAVQTPSGQATEIYNDYLARFLDEARTLAQIDHPSVVRVRAFFRDHGTAYLVMDYYEGETLEEYAGRHGGRVHWEVATQMVLELLDGLEAVHARGILHRDVKPQNVYLTTAGRVVLLDFGAAREVVGEHSRSMTMILSGGYAPIEQYSTKGREQGPWTDVYACAATLYRLITGVRVPDAVDRIGEARLLSTRAHVRDVPPDIDAAITWGLAVHARDRPRSASSYAAMIRSALDGTARAPRAVPAAHPPKAVPPARRAVHAPTASDTETSKVRELHSLPLRMGVMGDFAGGADLHGRSLRDRAFMRIDTECFGEVMASIGPRLTLSVADQHTGGGARVDVELRFRSIADFSPDEIVRQVDVLRQLWVVGDDQLRARQLDSILHHPEFQRLEASWRGLWYLVSRSGEGVLIDVLSVTKRELRSDLLGVQGVEESALFEKIYTAPLASGDIPFATLVGDYEFGCDYRDPPEVLSRLARVAAAAHAPFISSASPKMFLADRFTDLERYPDLTKIFNAASYAPWKAFRRTEEARYVALTCPRVLLREPYGRDAMADGRPYDEGIDTDDLRTYLWGNAAYVLAACMSRAFTTHGWCAEICGVARSGLVDGLAVHHVGGKTGEPAIIGPTDWDVWDGRVRDLHELGFALLQQYGPAPRVRFFSVPSTQHPKVYLEPEATAFARTAADLRYVLAVSRYAHIIRVLMRAHGSKLTSASEVESFLNASLQDHVAPPAEHGGANARRPLAEARVEVLTIPDQPGRYRAVAFLKPIFQLAPTALAHRVVVDLPAVGTSVATGGSLGQLP